MDTTLNLGHVMWGVLFVYVVRKVWHVTEAQTVEDEKLGFPTEMKDTDVTLKVPDVRPMGPYAVRNFF